MIQGATMTEGWADDDEFEGDEGENTYDDE